MSRMNIAGSPTVELEIPGFLGLNTADSFSQIDIKQSPKMLNGLPNKVGGLAKRPGTIPLTTAALAGVVKTLCNLRKAGVNTILATVGTTLYKYASGAFTGVTMTNPLISADIDYAQFKDANGAETLIIADGGNLKFFNGTAVANIVPAVDDASPAPANSLTTINSTTPPIGCIVHNTRLVIWSANSDTIHHSKVGYFDYFPTTFFQRFVRENDYVVQCASYSGALLVFMRRHIGVLFGDGYTSPASSGDWSQDFLDTKDGCVNPKSVQVVTYPDGKQEVFYQSDSGVHSVYTIDTLSLDSSARYSTKSMTRFRIDYAGLGVTKTNWQNAVSYFHEGKYWLIYKVGSTFQGIVFNTLDGEWYPIDNVKANSFYNDEDYFYFSGDDGHLKVFDSTLYSDWTTYNKAPGTNTPVNWYWYSKLMTPKLTGYDHLWDVLMIEAKQHNTTSTIDVEVNTYRDRFQQTGAIKTEIMIVKQSKIGEAQIANLNMTDIVNNAKRIPTFLRGQYAQVKLSNNRDEPVEVYSLKYETRLMAKY